MSIGKLGTQIRLPDGREGTVVYNGLDGVGVKWGLHDPSPDEFEGTSGGVVPDAVPVPDDFPWWSDAILRDPWSGCERCGWEVEQCVGEEYEVLRIGLGDGQ